MSDLRSENVQPAATPLRLSAGVVALGWLAVCLAPLVLALGRSVAPADPWESAAAALGLAALAAMATQFVSSGRIDTISGRLGIDRIMAFHKIAAWWVLLALLLHPLLYVLPTWAQDPALGVERLTAYLTLPHYRTGVIALGALVLLVLTSVLRDRLPWRYEVWRAAHVLLALAALGAGLHHATSVGRFSVAGSVNLYWWLVGAGVALVMAVLYGLRWARLHTRPWVLASVTRKADRMWELDIQPATGTPQLPYRAGQFVWLSVGRRRFPLLDNPFSIADSPARPGLSLIIKEAGDFTRTVGSLQPGTPVGIDGPYGEFVLPGPEHSDGIVLLAGGVGIAPIMGLLRDMVARRDPRPVRLAYAVGKPDNLACLNEIDAARQVLDLRVMLLSEQGAEGADGILSGMLGPARLGELMAGLAPARSTALICGPGAMVTAVSDALLDLGLPMNRVIYERFDYGGGAASRQDRHRSRSFLAIGAGLGLACAGFALLA